MNARIWPLLILAVAAAGCHRAPKVGPVPDIVTIKVPVAEALAYRALAVGCGAPAVSVTPAGSIATLVVGRENSLAARDCFFKAAGDEFARRHPVRAFFARLIG